MASSHVIGQDLLTAANSTFESRFKDLFQGAGQDDIVAAFCSKQPANDAKTLTVIVQDTLGGWAKLKGSRPVAISRVKTMDITLETWVDTLEVDRKDAAYDKSGVTAARIEGFLQRGVSFETKVLHDSLLSNSGFGPLCYDGEYLGSAAHPYAGSSTATQSNVSTTALSALQFDTALATMSSFLRENGEPCNVTPRFLVVGPKLRRLARELTEGALRTQTATAASVMDAAASAVAAAAIGNENSGLVTALIDNRLTNGGAYDDYWYLLGDSGADKPFIMVEGLKYAEQDTDPNGSSMFDNDTLRYGLKADIGIAGGAWQTIIINRV